MDDDLGAKKDGSCFQPCGKDPSDEIKPDEFWRSFLVFREDGLDKKLLSTFDYYQCYVCCIKSDKKIPTDFTAYSGKHKRNEVEKNVARERIMLEVDLTEKDEKDKNELIVKVEGDDEFLSAHIAYRENLMRYADSNTKDKAEATDELFKELKDFNAKGWFVQRSTTASLYSIQKLLNKNYADRILRFGKTYAKLELSVDKGNEITSGKTHAKLDLAVDNKGNENAFDKGGNVSKPTTFSKSLRFYAVLVSMNFDFGESTSDAVSLIFNTETKEEFTLSFQSFLGGIKGFKASESGIKDRLNPDGYFYHHCKCYVKFDRELIPDESLKELWRLKNKHGQTDTYDPAKMRKAKNENISDERFTHYEAVVRNVCQKGRNKKNPNDPHTKKTFGFLVGLLYNTNLKEKAKQVSFTAVIYSVRHFIDNVFLISVF